MHINKDQHLFTPLIQINDNKDLVERKSQSSVISSSHHQIGQSMKDQNNKNNIQKSQMQNNAIQNKTDNPIIKLQNKIDKIKANLRNISKQKLNIGPKKSQDQKQQQGRIIKIFQKHHTSNKKKITQYQKSNARDNQKKKRQQKKINNIQRSQIEIMPLTIQKEPKYKIGKIKKNPNNIASKVLNISLWGIKKNDNQKKVSTEKQKKLGNKSKENQENLLLQKKTLQKKAQKIHEVDQSEFQNVKVKLKNMNFPNLPQLPANKHQNQLSVVARKIFQLFNVCQSEQKMHMSIQKYKNCVHFIAKNVHVLWYETGKFYIGDYKRITDQEGYKHGYGIQFLPGKSVYQGQFKNNKKYGIGTLKFSNGDYYIGSFVQGLQNGKGKFYQNDTLLYDGDWKDGQMEGYGKLYLINSNIYEGLIVKGLENGYGTLYFVNGDKYQGYFRQGKFNGLGIYKWAHGEIYEGQFQNGCRHGTGIWKSKVVNGVYDEYNGEYRNDKKSGIGKYVWESGKAYYEGQFQNDQRHGIGVIKQQGEKLIKAIWKNGIMKKNLYQEFLVSPNQSNDISESAIDLQLSKETESQNNIKWATNFQNLKKNSVQKQDSKINHQQYFYQKLKESLKFKQMLFESKNQKKELNNLSYPKNGRLTAITKQHAYSTIQQSRKLNQLYH